MPDTDDNKPVFKFNHLPNELQVKITEALPAIDKHRFSHVSRKSRKFAPVTDDYVYGIELLVKSEFEVIIRVHVTPPDPKTEENVGYCVKFERIRHKRYMIFTLIDESTETSKTDLKTEENVIDLALEYYRQLLIGWKRCIRRIVITSSYICLEINLNQELENLRRLDILILCHNISLSTPLRLKQPLRTFSGVVGTKFFSLNQIFRVYFKLSISDYHLNIRHFEKLKAKVVFMPIGGLTEKYLYNFVYNWVQGTRKKEIYDYRFDLRNSQFNNEHFFDMFDVENENDQFSVIVKNEETQRTVNISAIKDYIVFHFTDPSLGKGTPLKTVFDFDL